MMLQIVVEVVCDADCGFTVLACAYFMCVLWVAEIKYVYVCMYVCMESAGFSRVCVMNVAGIPQAGMDLTIAGFPRGWILLRREPRIEPFT